MAMNTSLQKLDMALPIGSLDAYIAQVNQFPLLTLEEEQSLAQEFRDNSNLEAARRLVLAHLRFVVRIARGYSGYGLPQADLIQEGNIGLMKAVKRFDPTMGVRLVSFAVHWIKAEMHEFILRNWRIVKVATTKAQRKLFFNLRSATKKLMWFSNAEATQIATELNVDVHEVRKMEQRLNARDEAFDIVPNDDDEFVPSHYLEDPCDPSRELEANEWSNNREHYLQQALLNLAPRLREILQLRWLAEQKATLMELADKYNVSAERVRQLEKMAMAKLKAALAAHN